MSSEIKVPVLPESVADATVAKWYKKAGDSVKRDEILVDLETDKVMLEVPAPADGVLTSILKPVGQIVKANEVIGMLEAGEVAGKTSQPAESATPAPAPTTPAKSETAPAAASKSKTSAPEKTATKSLAPTATKGSVDASPAVRRMISAQDVDVSNIQPTGKQGRITKDDVVNAMSGSAQSPVAMTGVSRPEKRVPMSRLRARIAERLVQIQQTAAILTTFNEVNMAPIMDMRQKYKDSFEMAHGVKLGFMSFFVKAAVEALKNYPSVNASIDGNEIVYHGFFDIGIAVSTERGLVVPVIRDANLKSMAQIEKEIVEYANRARDGKITMEEMTGGTFTITNGGIFGSMLSTPIINPPQSGILGMHNIVKRAVVEDDEIVIRPIMYLALSYDHRIIDGRESVSFLVAIKKLLEDPARLLLEL